MGWKQSSKYVSEYLHKIDYHCLHQYSNVLSCPCSCPSSDCGGWQQNCYPPELVLCGVAIFRYFIVDFSMLRSALGGRLMPYTRSTERQYAQMWRWSGWSACALYLPALNGAQALVSGLAVVGLPVASFLACWCVFATREDLKALVVCPSLVLFHTRALWNSSFLALSPQSTHLFSSCCSQTAWKAHTDSQP